MGRRSGLSISDATYVRHLPDLPPKYPASTLKIPPKRQVFRPPKGLHSSSITARVRRAMRHAYVGSPAHV